MRNARRREIEAEILNSERLKGHFEENPRDLQVLRHDKVLSKLSQPNASLKHIPEYLLPASAIPAAEEKKKKKRKKSRKDDTRNDDVGDRDGGMTRGSRAAPGSRARDPLQSFRPPPKRSK